MYLPVRIRIVSDGTRSGTQILDERGDQLKGVTRAKWEVGPDGSFVPYVEIDLCLMPVDLDGQARYFLIQAGKRKEIKKIEFADDTELIAPPKNVG